MSIGPLITLAVAIAMIICAVVYTVRRRAQRRSAPPQVHAPHRPNAGYDRAEAIRKGVMGDNGHDR